MAGGAQHGSERFLNQKEGARGYVFGADEAAAFSGDIFYFDGALRGWGMGVGGYCRG